MIVWGSKFKIIDRKLVEDKCSHCDHNGLVQCTTQKFFTFFFIPTLPLKKYASYVCPNCATEYHPDAVAVNTVTKSTAAKTPLWGYSGLIIILLLMMFGGFMEYRENQLLAEYLESPKAGDMIVTKIADEKDTPYVFMKIKIVDGDKITLVHSKHMFSSQSQARKKAHAAKEDAFSEESMLVTKEDFQKMDIVTAERPAI